MTDLERLAEIRNLAYTIIGPESDKIERAKRYLSQITDSVIKHSAVGYMEMLAMAAQLDAKTVVQFPDPEDDEGWARLL